MTAPPPPPPPRVSALAAGLQLVAGLGHAEVLADVDVETYSEAGYVWSPEHVTPSGRASPSWRRMDGAPESGSSGIGLFYVGAHVYAEHPTTEVLTLSYNLKDGRGVRRWVQGQPPPADLVAYLLAGGKIESHNAGFERKLWNAVLVPLGFPPLDVSQQSCSMAKARAFGLPAGLANLQAVLGGEQKDKGGGDLIKLFSVPRNPTAKDKRLRTLPADEPEAFGRFQDYCDQDIEAEADASARIPDLSPEEREFWELDQRANDRGVAVDLPAIRSAIRIMEEVLADSDAELHALTDGAVARASETARLREWLADRCGVRMDDLTEESVGERLKALQTAANDDPELAPARRALEIRQAAGLASVKKLYQMRNCASSAGRLHDLYNYHGARTGRDTANGAQPTNMPNSGPRVRRCGPVCGRHFRTDRTTCPWCGEHAVGDPVEWNAQAADDAITVIGCESAALLADMIGSPLAVISACLRGMFIAGDGHVLMSGDYTAIEAVVLAMLSGEQWRISLFEEGGKLYEASGSRMTGERYEDLLAYAERTGEHHPTRKKGKVGELALGYGGWIGAMANFGADEWMTEQELKETIQAWRAASPAVVEFWGGQYRGLPWAEPRQVEYFGLEGAAIQAVLYPGREFSAGQREVKLAGRPYLTPAITYRVHGDVLYCTLPSGRRIAYQRPRLRRNERDRWGESYALSFEGWNSNPKKGPIGWLRMDLYGGLLCENVCQATARDVLRDAVVRLWKAGYPAVLRVYDEIASEVRKGHGSLDEFVALMGTMPAWATGWPIRVGRDAWVGHRYRK